MITMFEEAYKKQPHHEDLGVQTFFAIVRTGNWKAAQQVQLMFDSVSTSHKKHTALHENAQAVPRRSLHLLERHQCGASSEFPTDTLRIYPDHTFLKGRRSIYPGIYAPRALQALTSPPFFGDYPFSRFRRSVFPPPQHSEGTRIMG